MLAGMNARSPLETYSPYRFTWADVLRMVETGVLKADARVELIEGELVEVSPESLPHSRWKRWFTRFLVLGLADRGFEVAPDSPAVLDEHSAPEPDVYVFPSEVPDKQLKGSDIVLAVEIAVSSLEFDLERKAKLYARHGVQEYWVADVPGRRVVVHRRPQPGGYGSVFTVEGDSTLSPEATPDLIIDLRGLPPGD